MASESEERLELTRRERSKGNGVCAEVREEVSQSDVRVGHDSERRGCHRGALDQAVGQIRKGWATSRRRVASRGTGPQLPGASPSPKCQSQIPVAD
jgi:hypothetical protein